VPSGANELVSRLLGLPLGGTDRGDDGLLDAPASGTQLLDSVTALQAHSSCTVSSG